MTKTAAMVAILVTATGISGTPAHAGPEWKPCAELHDKWTEKVPEDKGGAECAYVAVPLDYSKPDGRKLNIAVSRLKAKGQRRGVMLMNPGGPGFYALPQPFSIRDSKIAVLEENYDLIGFDPRGVGFSAAQFCDHQSPPPPPPTSAEDGARKSFDSYAAWNKACAAKDPEFLAQITTANTARDMDKIREALGEQKISFYGVSYGTFLGAIYRGLFDSRVDRMWLDSVMPPALDMAQMDSDIAALGAADVEPFLKWLAARDFEYHLGKTVAEVRKTLLDLRAELDAKPRGDIDGMTVGGLASPSPNRYAESARDLVTLLEGGTPPGSQPVRAQSFGVDGFQSNALAARAVFCNEAIGGRNFADAWAKRQERLAKYPFTGGYIDFSLWCADWPFTTRPVQLPKGTSALQLSGHLYEGVTPYLWAQRMQNTVGGALLTIEDNAHSGARRLSCSADKMVVFFRTGRTDNGTCEGLS
ncbi:alpha/beta fold hydrolase [Kibdelosporangium aridum]|nr:alpha/beta fold hydrolase [Kibdelosporangium aridum]